MSITPISFYWRNDTPSFVTWRSRRATAPDTPTCIGIHGGQFTGGVSPPNQLVPEIVSPLPCSPALVRPALLIVYFFKERISLLVLHKWLFIFFKELISFIGSLDKCHTSVFNALITLWLRIHQSLSRTVFVFFSKIFVNLNVMQLLIGLTVRISQLEVVLHSNAA